MSATVEPNAIAAVAANPIIAFTDPKRFDEFYEAIRREVKAFVPDTSTKGGRDAIASLAYRVAQTKTAIDNAGKKLNEDANKQIKLVNTSRSTIWERLETLQKEARKPLDEWEVAEKTRVAECKATIERLKAAGAVSIDDTSEAVETRLTELAFTGISAERFGDMHAEALTAKEAASLALRAAYDRLVKQEAERAELANLRAEAEARAEADRIAAAEAARVEAQRVAAAQSEERRIAAEKAEAERIAHAEQIAAKKARDEAAAAEAVREAGRLAAQREAELKSAEAQAQRDREHAAELARLQRERDEADAARRAEADRIQREEAARKAEADRIAAEEERRAKDRKHRGTVMGCAKVDLMTHCGLDDETATSVVRAITAEKIRAVSIRF